MNQQKFFTEYLITESALQKEQTALTQKQLNAILALTPSKTRVLLHIFNQAQSTESCSQVPQINQHTTYVRKYVHHHRNWTHNLHPTSPLIPQIRKTHRLPTQLQHWHHNKGLHLVSEPMQHISMTTPALHPFN